MKRHKAAIGWSAMFALGLVAQSSPASAQTFESYRCADGTDFILAFYPGDERAYLQIDGRAVTLERASPHWQPIFRQRREPHHEGNGCAYHMRATGALIKRPLRPVTACELS